jgi:hypothetical protein
MCYERTRILALSQAEYRTRTVFRLTSISVNTQHSFSVPTGCPNPMADYESKTIEVTINKLDKTEEEKVNFDWEDDSVKVLMGCAGHNCFVRVSLEKVQSKSWSM